MEKHHGSNGIESEKIGYNILISGSTGFIGSTVIRLNHEDNFFGVSNEKKVCTKKHISSCASVADLTRFIRDNNIEVILHLATKFVRDDNFEQLSELIRANYELPTRLICAGSQANVSKFIFAGTSWEKEESDADKSKNLYAAVKKSFDSVARYFAYKHQLCVTKLNLFDTFGPYDSRNKLVDLIINSRHQPLTVNSPDQQINLTYSYDVYSAIMCVINDDNDISGFREFMVRSEETVKIRDLINIIDNLVDFDLNVNFGANSTDNSFIPSINLPILTGWQQNFSLIDGLKDKLKLEEIVHD